VPAIWRPAGLLTQLALPLTVVLQRRATKAYVDAAQRLLAASEPTVVDLRESSEVRS